MRHAGSPLIWQGFPSWTYGREAATGPNKRVACIVDISLLKHCPGNSLENHLQNRLRGFQRGAKMGYTQDLYKNYR
jgi:hypothetical protein